MPRPEATMTVDAWGITSTNFLNFPIFPLQMKKHGYYFRVKNKDFTI